MPRTSFHVDVDGFSFDNKYTYTDAEKQQVIDTIKSQKDVVLALFGTVTTADILATVFSGGLIPPGTVDTAAGLALAGVFDTLIKNAFPGKQEGFCGGMSFTAMDYYAAGWLSDRGFAPTTADSVPNCAGAPGALRGYIWQRHLDSLTSGAASGTIQAVLQAHYMKGGASGLLGKAKSEWTKLKAHLDAGSPWPICMVASSTDPTQSHQVLAIGYDQKDANHVALHVYDVDTPYDGSGEADTGTLELDFSGSALSIAWNDGRQPAPLVHFFCSNYSSKTPPIAVGIVKGVTGKAEALKTGAPFTVTYEVQNVGFGASVALLPVVEVERPAQSSHPTNVTPPPPRPLPRILSEDGPNEKPTNAVPVPAPVVLDVHATDATVVQTGLAPATLASAYIPLGDKTATGAVASTTVSTPLQEGRVYYYAEARIACADGSVIVRHLPPAASGAAAQASSDLPFPKAAPAPAPKPHSDPTPKPQPEPTPVHGTSVDPHPVRRPS